ncbi:chromate transporter [Paenibacillus sp. MDMC362]|uniref:chromate transporter n=1 Tax=Paenibacillus sp. MDMC362 TaxID=2977365 RepID=UPI0021A7A245|nr:chromate transporter [Paenibacillus sp. MDMC362]
MNAAAMIGHRQAGIAGAVSAVLGVTCPAFLIVILISVGAVVFRDQPKAEAALKGRHGAIIALIVFDATTTITALATVSVMLFTGVHPKTDKGEQARVRYERCPAGAIRSAEQSTEWQNPETAPPYA